MSVGRIIETDACVLEGVAALREFDPRFDAAFDLVGPLPLRRKPDGYAQLLNAIVGQQVSVASANAIWVRLEQAGMDVPENVRAVTEEDLKELGVARDSNPELIG